MKATCHREGLLAAFQVAASVVPARSPKPILRNCKLVVTPERSTLIATDLEIGIRYDVTGVDVKTPGEVVLPAHEMVAILREVSDAVIELEAADVAKVAGASCRFELPTADPLEFPIIPDVEGIKPTRLSAGALTGMISRTLFASAPENTRFAIHSVFFECDEQGARMAATDGKRLALMPGSVIEKGDQPEHQVLLPPKATSLLLKILADPDEVVELLVGSNEILARTGRVTVYSRLVEGRFPKYQDIFPRDPGIAIPAPVKQLAAVIRQAKIVTSEESRGVEFTFADGTLTLRSRAADHGESEIRMPIAFDDKPITALFDPQLLLDALRVLDGDSEVRLHLIDGKKAAVLRAEDGFAYVVMPLSRER